MNLPPVEDQFPSTGDCQMIGPPPISGGQEDWTLACIMNARARIENGHTTSYYARAIGDGVTEVTVVCAMGALYLEGGVEPETIEGAIEHSGMKLLRAIEDQLTAEAKEAIDVVSNAALELHPESKDYGDWAGPLEWVNQYWVPDEFMAAFRQKYPRASYPDASSRTYWEGRDPAFTAKIKAEILRIYDHAIAMRQGALVH